MQSQIQSQVQATVTTTFSQPWTDRIQRAIIIIIINSFSQTNEEQK